MNFSIPEYAPYVISVMAWTFAGVPIAFGLLVLAWIIKHVRFK